MKCSVNQNTQRLKIFHEGRKRRFFVGTLIYNAENDIYELIYDKKYVNSKNAIPIGPELDLFKIHHQSKKGKLFPSFMDRIPEKSNPAYIDYCISQGISPDESNPIILLGTIGSRGPSSFVFEAVYYNEFAPSEIIQIRKFLKITQHDLAKAFDISKTTLQRIETGISHDVSVLKYVQILFRFPEVALWQLEQTGNRIHREALARLKKYFQLRKEEEIMQMYLLEGYKYYEEAIASQKDLKKHGSFEVAFQVNHHSKDKDIDINEPLLQRLCPFLHIRKPHRTQNRWQELIKKQTRLDFWTITKKYFYHYRALRDDINNIGTAEAKNAQLKEIDFVWQIHYIYDAIIATHAFTEILGHEDDKTTLSFIFKWRGLKDRLLTSWGHFDYSSPDMIGNLDDPTFVIDISLPTTDMKIIQHTYDIACKLFFTFESYKISYETVSKIITDYQKKLSM